MPFPVPADSPFAAAPLLPSAGKACSWVLRIAILMGLAVGVSNLLAWVNGSAPGFVVASGMMVMRINTATGITAGALSLLCWSGAPGRSRRSLAQGLAIAAALIGTLTAMEDIAGINIGIDQLLGPATMPGDLGNASVRHPGRMSLNAALSMSFLGVALLGLDWKVRLGRQRFWVSPVFALLATLPVSLGLVGYLLGLTNFTGILRSTNILFHTAASLLALALGCLAARPERPPVRRILSPGADGLLLRWTLPGSVVLLLTLGWCIGRGRAAGLVVAGEGSAMMLYGGLVLIFGLLFVASRAVSRQEAQARASALALQEGQERSRAIVDTALDAVLLMDDAGIIVDWNPAAEQIFGWHREEVIGQPLAERIIPEDLRAAHYRGMAHLKETGHGPVFGKRLELPALRRDGTTFPVELSINPLPGPEPTLFVGFIRDITNRQAADEKLRAAKEAAEAALRTKDNFVAALSHELRTPLTPVLLCTAALRQDERLPADVRGQMAMMERNIALEARLIDDLLDLTRINRGKFRLRTEPCDTHSLLHHALEIVRDEARAKRIALDLDLSAERFGVTGDPARLQQVFWNLLRNAVKFTSAGGRVTIQTRDEADRDRLIIAISDTGVGFAPEAAEQIFQPFEQAGRDNDHGLGGLGLGLAIARAIVDLHGGTIQAHSLGAGQGATFIVEFPDPIMAPHGMLTANVNKPDDRTVFTPRRILLVEDHEPTLNVLTRLLTHAGHEVIPAQSVAAAQAAAANQRFDILVSDLGLPDGTGWELMTLLRAQYPNLPAVALSGYGMDEDLQRTRDAGFATHLVKPVDFDQLRHALQRLNSAS
ncbi:MAG: PAS domain S-box protein [Chthoniobacter sp.]|uniref:hybrid sensor histidine kinase/response regulator n=1 Tax=Chthoniobacter sp. TaxID=2510640 RepID=UPI0032A3FB78